VFVGEVQNVEKRFISLGKRSIIIYPMKYLIHKAKESIYQERIMKQGNYRLSYNKRYP